MNEKEKGQWLRGNPITYALSGSWNVDLAFLGGAGSHTAPEITAFMLEITGTVDSSAGTDASGFDAAKLISQIKIADAAGDFVDVSGVTARRIEQIELGSEQVDMTTLAAGAANASRTWQMTIPFELPRSVRPRDTRVELARMLNAATWTIRAAVALPTGWDGFTVATITPWVHVIDGRVREVKSRLTYSERTITGLEDYYSLNGSARWASISSVLTTTGDTSMAAIVALDSRTLGFPAGMPPSVLVREYRRHQKTPNTNDPHLAATIAAVPLIVAERQQKIGAMPDIDKLHLDLNVAIPTGAVLISATIKDRDPALAAMVLGRADGLEWAREKKTIVSAKGKHLPSTQMAVGLRSRLPVRPSADGGSAGT